MEMNQMLPAILTCWSSDVLCLQLVKFLEARASIGDLLWHRLGHKYDTSHYYLLNYHLKLSLLQNFRTAPVKAVFLSEICEVSSLLTGNLQPNQFPYLRQWQPGTLGEQFCKWIGS